MTLAGYRVVLAQRKHFAALREIERAAETIFSQAEFPLALRGQSLTSDEEFSEAQSAGLLWCAQTNGGEVIGYAIALWLGRDLHLDEIDVHPEHQQRGVGRALIDVVRAHALANGAQRLTLTTFRFVPWNMPWYARLGFAQLAGGAVAGELAEIFEAEIARGLLRERRVAMALELAP